MFSRLHSLARIDDITKLSVVTGLLNLSLTCIAFLATLGGWTVILGCILVALGRHRTGNAGKNLFRDHER